ncbi:MAG TPA: hypothetical protein VER08_10955 [Pyrinomonadaceae bacterium]|nr:hypothetical protein [Pyrinomonadaceae bacterium]
MKAFRLPGARRLPLAALTLLCVFGANFKAVAQTPGPTPDIFTAQVTNSQTDDAFAYGISGNGRFVVIESTGNLAPENPLAPTTGRNNADGNREIFLFDYAQRRIFQITNTRDALVNPANPRIPTANPRDYSNIDVEVSNHRPAISYDGKWLAFSSNAAVDGNASVGPGNFNGNDHVAALRADGNAELFLYRIPDVTEADLTAGTDVPAVNLAGGTFTRVTTSPASLPPKAGAAFSPPEFADDNRFPSINDDGTVVAFISSRNLAAAGGNADLNPEVFAFRRSNGETRQLTATANPPNSAIGLVFNANPTLSGDGSAVAFISSADFGLGVEDVANRGGAEIFYANTDGATLSNLRQVTRTPNDPSVVNILSFGRRISRNGRFLLFDTRADIQTNGAVNGALLNVAGTYLYNVEANSFTPVGPRAAAAFGQFVDVQHHATFTGDSTTIVFASALNFLPTGAAPPTATSTEGLNPNLSTQLFSTPVASPTTFSRLTNAPVPVNFTLFELVPQAAETLSRVAFSYRGELGGGKGTTGASEVFYNLTPAVGTAAPASAVSFLTGASFRPVAAPSPAPRPSPTPGETVLGVAPGMLAVARSTTVTFSPATREIDDADADERVRRPPLPIELNGVSVSVNGAAAGLYFVSPGQINFVVPAGLTASATPANVVIRASNGAVVRTTILIIAAQPDLFTTTNGPGGRAVALNVTNPCVAGTPEPAGGFPVTSSRPTGGTCTATTTETVPTELFFLLTGVRNVTAGQVSVQIRSTTANGPDVTISGSQPTGTTAGIVSIMPTRTAGFDQIVVRLPANLAGAGDSTVVVSVTIGGQTFTSRPVATAPLIRIQ